jgi:hypothetical protein
MIEFSKFSDEKWLITCPPKKLKHFAAWSALQIILDLCIPEKELAKTHSQISFLYFQSHS